MRDDGSQRLSETVILPTSQGAEICLSKGRDAQDSYQNNYQKNSLPIYCHCYCAKCFKYMISNPHNSPATCLFPELTEVQESKIAPAKSSRGRTELNSFLSNFKTQSLSRADSHKTT